MSYYKLPKYVTIDPSSPEALGVCDYSQFVFNRKDLVRQMEYRGNALVWTGFYVGKPFLDVPNPQLLPPILPPDPVPVPEARLPQPSVQYFNTLTIPFNQLEAWQCFNMLGAYEQGVPAMSIQDREAALQNSNLMFNQYVAGGPLPQPPDLSQAQIEAELEDFNWGAE